MYGVWRGSKVHDACLDVVFFISSSTEWAIVMSYLLWPCIFMAGSDRGSGGGDTGGWGDVGVGGDGVGGMRRACRSVSRFQTSEFF